MAGFILTDKTDNTKVLFFPSAGYAQYDVISNNAVGAYAGAYCLTSTLSSADKRDSFYFSVFHEDNYPEDDSIEVSAIQRYCGLSARGVLDE